MTRKRRTQPSRPGQAAADENVPPPVDIVDGIPDRCEHAPKWKYILLAVVFVAWLAFLIYCAAAGRP
jgi:hypothetical protein